MFQVEWLQAALADLADAWLKADSSGRTRITLAARQIDADLKNDPDEKGESRSAGRRILFVEPLAAIFRVYPAQKAAVISGVWRFGRPRRSLKP